jgi:hypothetical protein
VPLYICFDLPAERRLAKADFVAMNQQQGEEGGVSPVLPVGQLEEIFDRVVRDEILVRGEAAKKDFAVSIHRHTLPA